MPSDNRDPGTGRRPPTIDLTATEVGSSKPASDPSPSGEPKHETKRSGANSAPPPSAPPERRRSWDSFIGAAIGAGIVLVIGGAAWRYGLKPQQADPVLSARLARIEAQIHDTIRPAPPTDTKSLSDIAARLAKVEAALAAQSPSGGSPKNDSASDPALAERVGEAETAAKAATEEVVALRTRLDEITALVRDAQRRADAAAGSAEAAQKSSQSTTAELARAAQPDDRTSRRAVAANALRAAVERGEPFSAELAAAKAVAPDRAVLAPLEAFAANGVVSDATLARELTALIPALVKANAPSPSDTTLLARLQASAERVVRVRPVGEVAGSDPASAIARIESKARQSDIDGALGELAKLPPAIRAPADGWIKTAEQRKAAIAASRQFARDALAALAKPSL